jgi:hypothetical protein
VNWNSSAAVSAKLRTISNFSVDFTTKGVVNVTTATLFVNPAFQVILTPSFSKKIFVDEANVHNPQDFLKLIDLTVTSSSVAVNFNVQKETNPAAGIDV